MIQGKAKNTDNVLSCLNFQFRTPGDEVGMAPNLQGVTVCEGL